MLKQFVSHPLYIYDKTKVNWLKAIFPIIIIIHHISNFGYSGMSFMNTIDAFIMPMFFAMSGYGLVICYKNRNNYIYGFLKRSLSKLFVPYLIALICFVTYREWGGQNQLELLRNEGLMSFVPTSWFIWTLSYFYIFFYIVFRSSKATIGVKVLLVCGLVLAYTWIAPRIGIPFWRYRSNPGFCVGMIFALFDENIRRTFVRWQVFLVLCAILAVIKLHLPHFPISCLFPFAMFLLMYMVKGLKENIIVRFLSSISLEMYIIQCIPIYILMNDIQVKSTVEMVCLTIVLDVILAYLMHLLIQRVSIIIK